MQKRKVAHETSPVRYHQHGIHRLGLGLISKGWAVEEGQLQKKDRPMGVCAQ